MTAAAASGSPPASVEIDAITVVGPAQLRLSVRVAQSEWQRLDPAGLVARLAGAIGERGNLIAPGASFEGDVLFSCDAEVRALNARYRGKDRATNVLAFPSGEAEVAPSGMGLLHLGGIVLSYGQTAREAVDRAIPLTHHATHLTLHGLLHLLGFDHELPEGRAEMERIEIEVLRGLAIADPYCDDGSI